MRRTLARRDERVKTVKLPGQGRIITWIHSQARVLRVRLDENRFTNPRDGNVCFRKLLVVNFRQLRKSQNAVDSSSRLLYAG